MIGCHAINICIAVAKVTQISYSEARPQSCWRAEAGSVGIQRLRNEGHVSSRQSVQHGDRIFRQESKYLVLYRKSYTGVPEGPAGKRGCPGSACFNGGKLKSLLYRR